MRPSLALVSLALGLFFSLLMLQPVLGAIPNLADVLVTPSSPKVDDSLTCSFNATDAVDEDSNTWSENSCDSTSGDAFCRYACDGTLTLNPTLIRWAVQSAAGTNVASIDKTGTLFLSGSLYEGQGSLSPPAGSFVIENATTDVAYISSSGDLYLRGTVTEQAAMTPTGRNYEVWNHSERVAFFDEQGNLKLKNRYEEGYSNP